MNFSIKRICDHNTMSLQIIYDSIDLWISNHYWHLDLYPLLTFGCMTIIVTWMVTHFWHCFVCLLLSFMYLCIKDILVSIHYVFSLSLHTFDQVHLMLGDLQSFSSYCFYSSLNVHLTMKTCFAIAAFSTAMFWFIVLSILNTYLKAHFMFV